MHKGSENLRALFFCSKALYLRASDG